MHFAAMAQEKTGGKQKTTQTADGLPVPLGVFTETQTKEAKGRKDRYLVEKGKREPLVLVYGASRAPTPPLLNAQLAQPFSTTVITIMSFKHRLFLGLNKRGQFRGSSARGDRHTWLMVRYTDASIVLWAVKHQAYLAVTSSGLVCSITPATDHSFSPPRLHMTTLHDNTVMFSSAVDLATRAPAGNNTFQRAGWKQMFLECLADGAVVACTTASEDARFEVTYEGEVLRDRAMTAAGEERGQPPVKEQVEICSKVEGITSLTSKLGPLAANTEEVHVSRSTVGSTMAGTSSERAAEWILNSSFTKDIVAKPPLISTLQTPMGRHADRLLLAISTGSAAKTLPTNSGSRDKNATSLHSEKKIGRTRQAGLGGPGKETKTFKTNNSPSPSPLLPPLQSD